MEQPPQLALIFLDHAATPGAPHVDMAQLEAQLRCAWEAARTPWPRVALSAPAFVRHLAQRLPRTSQGSPLVPRVDELALGDLYLACACLGDVPHALQLLESHHLARLPGLLEHLQLPDGLLDEVCQWVRIHLLMGPPSTGPRLAEYTGRGALLSWLRVMALRRALKQAPAHRVLPAADVAALLEALPSPELGADLALFKRRHGPEFRQAVHESFAALSREQRYHLRLHFIDRLSTTELGALFRVSQSTVSRWLKSARRAVYEDTKRRLQERLGLSSREFTSLVAALESQADLNLQQLLKEDG